MTALWRLMPDSHDFRLMNLTMMRLMIARVVVVNQNTTKNNGVTMCIWHITLKTNNRKLPREVILIML